MNLEALIDAGFRGCIQIAVHGRTVFEKACGYADLPNRIPNDSSTKFATASAGKVFVAAGILQLIEKGKLNFNDTIGDMLDFDLKAIDRNITIKELLTHTSGIPDYFDESVMEDYEDLWRDFPNYKIRSNRDLLPLFLEKPMTYPHGSRFQYNNTGFVVLAIIMESITGAVFDEWLEDHIFAPCGMTSTGYYELDRLPAKCASNYICIAQDQTYRTNIFSVDAKGTGAGGAFTTVGDIRRFWDHLMSGRLLSPEMTADMIRNHSGGAQCYGYGVWLKKQNGVYSPYIQGSDPGVSFISSYRKENETVITLVSNYGDNVWQLHKMLAAELENRGQNSD